MAKVNRFLRTAIGRLACASLIGTTRPFSTVVASATAAPGEQTIFGSALPLELGQDKGPPEWVRLIPPGTFSLNDGRGPFRNADPDQAIAASKAMLAGRDAPGDYDHATEYTANGAQAIAAGWVKDWRVRDGAIEGRVQWTTLAAQRIRDLEYRYLSPVFHADDQGNVIRVLRFALTNNPAIDQLPAIAAAQRQEKEKNDVTLSKLLAQALGLPETTTDAELLGVVGAMKQTNAAIVAAAGAVSGASHETIVAALRDKPDPAKWIAAAEHQKLTTNLQTITAERDGLLKKATTTETETVIADAIKAGKIVPAQKDYWTKVCADAGTADPLKKYLETAPVVVKPGEEPRKPGSPDTITAATLSDEQKRYCAEHKIDPEAFVVELRKVVASGEAATV